MFSSRSIMRLVAFNLVVSGAFFFCGTPVYADVTVERLHKFGGYYGQGAFEANEKTSYRGLKQRIDRTRKFTGSFLSKVTGISEVSTIIRVKDDVIWQVDHEGKSYKEEPITPESAEQAEEGNLGSKSGKGSKGKGEKEERTHRVIKNEVKLKETGQKKTINGFDCQRYIVTWLLITEEIATKEQTASLMTNDLWNTNHTKATRELEKSENDFLKAYMAKLKLNLTPGDMKQMGLKFIAGASPSNGKKLRKIMKKIKGYSIVSSVKWEQGSAQAKGKRAEKKKESGGGWGGIGSLGDALGAAAKKAMEKEKKPGEKEVIFSSYTEIKSISTGAKAKDHFSIPADYKKKG